MTPRVSVVTTVYNGEPYFDRAIPGILAQTFEDFEFILVDDGSQRPDARSCCGSWRVATRGSGSSLPGRLGAAAAYNYGVAQARGRVRRPPGLR